MKTRKLCSLRKTSLQMKKKLIVFSNHQSENKNVILKVWLLNSNTKMLKLNKLQQNYETNEEKAGLDELFDTKKLKHNFRLKIFYHISLIRYHMQMLYF